MVFEAKPPSLGSTNQVTDQPPIPNRTFVFVQAVKLRFDYIFGKPRYLDEAKNILERPVSYLKFNVIDVNACIDPDDIPIRWCV